MSLDLSVLIASCDSSLYSCMWKPFQICFDRYWKRDTDNIIVTEQEIVPQYTNTKFATCAPGVLPWGQRIIKGLEECSSDNVFFIMEDYLFFHTYSPEQMGRYLELVARHNIKRLQIAPSGHQTYTDEKTDGLTRFSDNSDYLVSMQPSIFNRQWLLDILEPSWTPWDFEIRGSRLLKYKHNKIYIDQSVPEVYFNAIRRGGKRSLGYKEFFEREGLEWI